MRVFPHRSVASETIAAGTTLSGGPRIDSSERDYRTGLLLRVITPMWRRGSRMTHACRRQPLLDHPSHSFPSGAVLLTSPRHVAMPKPVDLESKHGRCLRSRSSVVHGWLSVAGGHGNSRFSREVFPYMHGASDRAGPRCTECRLSLVLTVSASRRSARGQMVLSQLNTRPARQHAAGLARRTETVS